ncbi:MULTISPECIES: TetR/AcrR family transcriptional regulator [Ensifer]|jgi:AcrR family transcriptional regulator|uniref:TetR family transcriptional regulator n=1 Tax=Ensifer canadensis TaxID=555315 RepID=A0AAW4FKZ1_9HYPH|nr:MULTISPECIES: TetR/AcrR family transcriptional regulator [Ensifer]AHK46196.1 transcriptional regulator, TetR/ArcR family [Ensifer adhaerens OV14]MDP9631088.1 AcrR family transcriptional regulator [Ensifer adhaerens]KQU82055.1 TetR family transcriptional regulator [Ensifer sp. Root31]KQW61985.1 TetR family transcriptional regulator [Ensifer sp. Root1252]KQW82092.1 TetR family transcriptional regulator [Ensifer sp. Root127]
MAARAENGRKNDPQRTKEDILIVATDEFATHGLAGARVDAIAEKTRTSKRMIYYYFESKEGLYLSVLERSYRKIRTLEADLQLSSLAPEAALRTLISTTFDHDQANPEFVRLVSIENIHHAAHMMRSEAIRDLNVSVIETIAGILERGVAEGVFQRKADPIDVHMLISAFCFFRVSNRYTFGTIFRRDLCEPETMQRHKGLIADAVLSYLKTQE